jgi:protein SCO1/2
MKAPTLRVPTLAVVTLAFGALLVTVQAAAAGADRPLPRAALRAPPAVAAVDVDEKLGARLPLELTFTDAAGRSRKLGELFDQRRPVILVLAYYRCPMLCDLVLSGISTSLRKLGWALGSDYRGLTVSIDPRDTPVAAHHKQVAVLQAMNESGPAAEASWPFLVGDAASIGALADAVGFRYAHDPTSDQFAHPAVVMVLTPDGRVSRYLYGVNLRLLDVRLGMTEAASGSVARPGGLVERVLLTCFRYDPSARKYGFYVSTVLRGGASVVILSVFGFLAFLWRRDARRLRGRERP